jgi:hypothetical protein
MKKSTRSAFPEEDDDAASPTYEGGNPASSVPDATASSVQPMS